MVRVVLEVGPAAVRRLGGARGAAGEQARAALDGIDDSVVLLDESPVRVSDLWRGVVESVLGPDPGDVLIMHPSWWPDARVDRVLSAASGVCDSVAATSRCAFVARRSGRPVVVVEIDAEFVTVGHAVGEETFVLSRRDPAAVADLVARIAGARGERVILDSPRDAASDIRNALTGRGIPATHLDIDTLLEPPSPSNPKPAKPGLPRRVGVVAAVLGVGILGAGLVGAGALVPRRTDPVPAAGAPFGMGPVDMVEGRVTVRIPGRWAVVRVTEGPGSRRVRVSSPVDPESALHVTGSYAPEVTLAEAGAVLARAIAGQPAGVFVGLRSAAVAGRDVLTYRENRPGRVIRWTVLLDGSTRIAVGCQSAPGREQSIAAACDDAVSSARETPA